MPFRRPGPRGPDVGPRLGGDELGVLLREIPNHAYAIAVADRLLEDLGRPIEPAGRMIESSASIGIAFDGPPMQTADELLSEADIAMYQAKAHGKGRCHVYRPSDGQEVAVERTAPETIATVRRPTVTRSTAPRPI